MDLYRLSCLGFVSSSLSIPARTGKAAFVSRKRAAADNVFCGVAVPLATPIGLWI